MLGIGRTFMFELIATGEIDSFKIGSRRRISHDTLTGYIERLRAEQAAAADRHGRTRRLGRQRDGEV